MTLSRLYFFLFFPFFFFFFFSVFSSSLLSLSSHRNIHTMTSLRTKKGLPFETLSQIFDQLSFVDQCSCQVVCKVLVKVCFYMCEQFFENLWLLQYLLTCIKSTKKCLQQYELLWRTSQRNQDIG